MKRRISNFRILLIVLSVIVLVLVIAGITLFQEVVYRKIPSADGRYIAVVTYRRYEAWRPTLPGHSGDKAGFISIYDSAGVQYGRMPIPMVSMGAELEWTLAGAELKCVGEWNFSSRTCRIWNG
jgi:hypothetical protein